MGKKKSSQRRQPKKGGGSASSTTATAAAADEDAFLEQAMKQAATEKAALDQIAINEAATAAAAQKNETAKNEEAKGSSEFNVQEFTKEYMGDFIARTVAQRQPSSSGGRAWSHLPPDQAAVMTQWEKAMPPSQRLPNTSAAQTLKNMNITPQFVKGIPIGDWLQLINRMELASKRVYMRNIPALQRGDYVEVLPGNHVKWALVGERGVVMDYFDDEDKWGMEMDKREIEPSLVFAGNLKRLSRFNEFDY
mmetsp:Transcript_20962/g.34591  ORF Transcript_20962/g.34591 Transcript_20962/m.34591 type:complete len:250 (+) Transcript_20962:169-918(+)